MTNNEEEAVFPLTLPRDVFVTVQDDNIDISISVYHGTAISVTTHSTRDNPGCRVPFPEIKKKVMALFHCMRTLLMLNLPI